MATTDDPLRKGATFLDRFEIIKPLGMGLLGAVYRARDLNDPDDTKDGNVALKLLRHGEKATAIKDEASVLQRLREVEDELDDGFHAAPKYLIGSADDPQPYIALEFMRGKQVITLLRENEKGEVNAEGRLPEAVALDIARQLFRLLRILHENMGKTYIDLKFENLWWDGKMLKVTDWNVLEDKTDEGIKRDLFRGSLYLYRMLTGVLPKLRSNMDVGALDAAPAWKNVTEGTQYLLSLALHTVPSRRFTSAEQIEQKVLQLVKWWQEDMDGLIGEANMHAGDASGISKRKSPTPLETVTMHNHHRDMRHIVSIVRQRVPAGDKRLEFLESELHDDLPKSIALFRGGSDQKALSLMEAAYPRAIDPAPIRWWIGLMQFFIQPAFKESVKNPKPLAELAADAAEKYAAKDFKAAKSRFDIFVNALKEKKEIKEEKEIREKGERELALLRDAIEAQEMIADALKGNGADADNALKNVFEIINRAGELNPYLPDDFTEMVKEQLGVEIRLARDEHTRLQDIFVLGEELFAGKKFYEAGQKWLEGLTLHPENTSLLERIRESIHCLLTPPDPKGLQNPSGLVQSYGQALNLIEQIPSLTSQVNDLHALWDMARAELAKQKFVSAQYDIALAMLNVEKIEELPEEKLSTLKGSLEEQREKLIKKETPRKDILDQFDELIQKLSNESARRRNEKKFAPAQDLIRAHIKDAPNLNTLIEKKDYLDKKIKEVHDLSEFVEQLEIELASLNNEVPALRQWLTEFMKRLKVNEAIQQRQKKIALIRELIEKHEKSFSDLSDEKIDELLAQLEGHKKTAGEVADVAPALVGQIENFAEKLKVAKAERRERATLGDRARLIAELNDGAIVNAIEIGRRYFAEFNETQIRGFDVNEKDLHKAIENAAKQFVPEKSELVDQFIAVFGKALRNESELRTAVLDREKKKWKDKFKPLHEYIANNKIEEAFAEMERLVESDTPLHDDLVKVWRDEWSEVVVDILSLDSDKNHSHLLSIIKPIWATDEEHQQFWDSIRKSQSERASDLAKLQQEHQDLLWKRLNASIFKNDNDIQKSQGDSNLTINRFEELLDEVLNLITYFETNGSQPRASDPTLKTNAKRFESYQGTLTKAKELWATAKAESDKDRQRNILAELRKYKFSGLRLPGDFEKGLGLPEERPHSKPVAPFVSEVAPVKAPIVNPKDQTVLSLKSKELVGLKARVDREKTEYSASLYTSESERANREEPSYPASLYSAERASVSAATPILPDIEAEIAEAKKLDAPQHVYKKLLDLRDRFPNHPRLLKEIDVATMNLPQITSIQAQILEQLKNLEVVNPSMAERQIEETKKSPNPHPVFAEEINALHIKLKARLKTSSGMDATEFLRKIYDIDYDSEKDLIEKEGKKLEKYEVDVSDYISRRSKVKPFKKNKGVPS